MRSERESIDADEDDLDRWLSRAARVAGPVGRKTPYRFPGLNGRVAWCDLAVIALADGKTVVVAAERPDNPGASVTNAAEELATHACQTLGIDPAGLVWVEHYPADSPAAPRRDNGHPTWDLVTFSRVQGAGGWARPPFRWHLVSPRWRPMTPAHWESLGLPAPHDARFAAASAPKEGGASCSS